MNIAEIALIFQLPQIGNFPPAEKVYPLEGKIFKKAHYCPHWPVKVGNVDLPAKPLSAPYTAKIERIVLLEVNINQIQNGKMRIRHGIIVEKTRDSCNITMSTLLTADTSQIPV
jgi:hypothetical protein